MSTFLLILSTICFIAAFGIHMCAKGLAETDFGAYCGYMSVPWMCAIPWISGFILAVIPETILSGISWIWVFLINALVVFILGPALTNVYMKRLASGKGAGVDIIIALLIGITTLIIAIALKS